MKGKETYKIINKDFSKLRKANKDQMKKNNKNTIYF
jgi:hypothetical protein